MSPEYLARVQTDWEQAYYAEANGDFAEALRLYELVWGAAGMISATEKDGLRIEFGKLEEKIASLKAKVGSANGSGKVRRIPVEFHRTGGNVNVDDGYAWGY